MMTQDKAAAITQARRLLRGADRAALATALCPATAGDAPWPYPSFVLTAADYDGAPLLFISGLAEHTRNLAVDSRAGLLFQATDGLDEPLAGARLSLLGRLEPVADAHCRARFLNRHPSAERLTALGDFAFYRLGVARAHLIAGFGRARWLDGGELLPPIAAPVEAMAAAEVDCLAALNAGQAADAWRWTGVDPDGADLRRGDRVRRIDFSLPSSSPADWPALMDELRVIDIL